MLPVQQRADRRGAGTCASHPLKLYFDLGLRVTVNTDNRLITDTTVSQELWLVHTQMGVPFRDIKSMIVAWVQVELPAVPREAGVPAARRAELERYDDDGGVA